MRVVLFLGLAALLIALALSLTRHKTSPVERAAEGFVAQAESRETDHHELAPVREAAGRSTVWDPGIEIDPNDYAPEPPQEIVSEPALEPELQGFEVSGTLVIPTSWADADPDVVLCPAGGSARAMSPVQRFAELVSADGSRVRSWRGRVQGAGQYWVATSAPAYCIEVAVAGDLADVKLVLPDPIEMECLVLDAETRAPFEDARVSFRPRDLPSARRMIRADKDEDVPGLYRWKCIAVAGSVLCTARDFELTERVLSEQDLLANRRLRIELLRPTRILVKLRDARTGADIPWQDRLDPGRDLVVEQNGEPIRGVRWGMRQREVAISTPGKWGTFVLRVAGPPPGFNPSYPASVFVREHETAEITFDLVAK